MPVTDTLVQWLSTFLMLFFNLIKPFNTVHVVVTSTIKLFHCYFITIILLLLGVVHKYLICNPQRGGDYCTSEISPIPNTNGNVSIPMLWLLLCTCWLNLLNHFRVHESLLLLSTPFKKAYFLVSSLVLNLYDNQFGVILAMLLTKISNWTQI